VPEDNKLTRGAQNILLRSFGLRRDQNLLIFADVNSLEVVEVIARVARGLGIHTTALYVPRVMQAENGASENLPLPAEAAVREADAILSCLSDLPEHRSYRMRVLQTGWSRRTKLGHAPGLTTEILRMADTDYAAICEQAQLLSLALILGKRIEIVTTDSRRREHRLNAHIGGWDYPPGIADGVIRDGAWGNLPPGEVYIVPRDGDGKIVINGSLPGRVLAAGEEIILTFRDGRFAGAEPADSPALRHLQETQIAYAERRGDDNWSNLAEIGFGLNSAVRDLLGVSIVDEKKAHTVHVALGHSATLGGDVDSVIHCDMVAKKPTVYISGRLIMKRGDWRINEADWRLDHRTVTVPAGWWERITHFGRSGVRAERENGRLVYVWNAGRGRWDSAAVGQEQTARMAARVYDMLPETGSAMAKDRLVMECSQAGIPAVALPGLFWVMQQFDLVRITASREMG
jgi:hypothetical protein